MKRFGKAFIALISAGGMLFGTAAVAESAVAATRWEGKPLYDLSVTPTTVSTQNVDQMQYSYSRNLDAELPPNNPAPDKVQATDASLIMALVVDGKSCINWGKDLTAQPSFCVPADGVSYVNDPNNVTADNLYSMFKIEVPTDGNKAPFTVGPTALPASLKSIITRGLKTPHVTGVDFWLTVGIGDGNANGSDSVRVQFSSSPAPSPDPSPSPSPSESPFSDVVKGKTPHYDDILWLADQKITSGYADGTFGGGRPVVRQDMAAFLYRLAGSPNFTPDWSKNPFSDVNANTSHAKEVMWLYSTGIAKGFADGTFGGTKQVLRQDMAAFLHRLAIYLKASEPTGSGRTFTDVTSNTSHSQDIAWLSKTGVTNGYSDGSFGGLRPVVRQDMAAFLHRLKANVLK
ncbi:S-layer homology domain-containing protein [Bifidobacterium miconisargentati]|uniref:S-layer homology domain-containing protein n=1 Tax=Bifidobacterium miconisargentati TaxID=2834437 RepID=UPI001BDC0F4B|nr:S-layer homology domain-containing protein [Bifidobacterium miconisargentati]MBW3090476.1 S-layer homology domain-containing protein [Bifidobacterium miconisargentati]